MSPVRAVLADEDFRFRLTLQPEQWGKFFAPTAEVEAVQSERRHWLDTKPQDFLWDAPSNQAAWQEVAELVGLESEGGTSVNAMELGRRLEADIVLMKRDTRGAVSSRRGSGGLSFMVVLAGKGGPYVTGNTWNRPGAERCDWPGN
ncbi:MAG: hypothetical protein J6386_07675 [Candidatus Synoicihabitans palmerolidicus]|nr:hypothetical protein [Candidatus Synoicihabitans palmerolidicus]